MSQDDLIHDLVAETEKEIFNDAAGAEPIEEVGGDRSLEAVDGWDGESLPDAEQWETTINPRGQSHVDRPLQLRAEHAEIENTFRENEALKAENAQLHQIRQTFDPQIRAEAEQRQADRRLNLVTAALDRPDEVLNTMDQMHSHRVQLDTARVENSMQAAKERYGDEFDRAYGTLVSQSKTDPLARATVQNIWTSRDPGEQLMRLASGGIPSSSGDSQPPPFMPGKRTAAPGRKISDENFESAARAGSDADIWEAATRD
jgi:hypothetical protein